MRYFAKNVLLPIVCLVTSFFYESKAQNLVVNPSFEITNTNCSGFGGEGFRQDLDPTWDNANSNLPGDSCSSPDLFSACNLAFTNMPGGGLGSLGYQYSHTGTRHVGLIAYSAPFGIADNYREYIQGHTTTPLVGGQTYCVSMYVSLADGSPWAIKELGVYFSNTHYLRDACAQGSGIYLTPHLENTCGIIKDTSKTWVRLQWDYVATGGEQYFVIGNFRNDASTTKASTGASSLSNMFAYYFIDDVSIVANSCCYAAIAPVSAQCASGSAITMTATTGTGTLCPSSLSGTWSGPGITNATTGVFNPSVAGVGVHTISLTLTCGYTATTSIAVSPCAVLNVCKESNGALTASNGVAPYSWSVYVPATSTPITNQAQCQACGYSWVGFPLNQCLNGITPATSCTTAATWSVYATGTTAMPPSGATQVVVTDASGTTLTVTPSSVPNCTTTTSCPTLTLAVTSQTNVNCFGASTGSASINTTGGTSPYTYTWSPGNLSGSSQTGLLAGTYTINIKDANQCPGTGTLTITQPTAALSAVITGTTNAGCGLSNGSATVTPNGGTAGYTYTWTPNGGSTASVSNLSSGNNTVTVTDSKGCTATAVAVINSAGGPTLTVASQASVACFGASTGSASINATGGTGPYTYTWSPGNLSGSSQNALGAGTYTVNVKDANQCAGSITVSIAQPTAALSGIISATTAASCGANNGGATITASGGTPSYTYSWSPNGGSGTSASNLAAGNNTVTIKDANGCTQSIVVAITSAGGPTVTVTSQANVKCFGALTGSATVAASGGTGPYSYTWSPGNLSGASQTGLAAGIYTISAADNNLCVGSTTVNIAQPASAVTATVNSSSTACGLSTGSATVSASGGTSAYTYSWSNGSSGTSVSGLSAGSYSVTVTDGNGCQASAGTLVNSLGGATVAVTSLTNATCYGGHDGAAAVSASGGSGIYTYTWSPSGGNSATATGLSAGVYTVTVSDGSCTSFTTVTIGQGAGFSVDAGPTVLIQQGASTVLSGTGPSGGTFIWSPGDGSLSCTSCTATTASPSLTTTYTLSVTNSQGCTYFDTVTVIVDILCGDLFIPSAFSPNDDGQNDVLFVMGNCVTNLNFAIFDRWGEKVFESTSLASGWDGTFHGKKMDPAVFAYYLTATVKGEDVKLHGSITIVK